MVGTTGFEEAPIKSVNLLIYRLFLNSNQLNRTEINETNEIVLKKATQKRYSETVEISHYSLREKISQLIYRPKKY